MKVEGPDRIEVAPFGIVSTDGARAGEYVWAELVERLAAYADHGTLCAAGLPILEAGPCDCGLKDLLECLTSPADPPPPAGEPDGRAASRELSTDGQGDTLPPEPSNPSGDPARVVAAAYRAAYREAIASRAFVSVEDISELLVRRLIVAGVIASPAGGTAAGAPPVVAGDGAAPPRDAPSAGGDRS